MSHIFLSIDSDLILSLFNFLVSPRFEFYFKNPKISVPLLVPHPRLLSWAPFHRAAAAWECTGERKSCEVLVRELLPCRGVCGAAENLTSDSFGPWLLRSSITGLMALGSPH